MALLLAPEIVKSLYILQYENLSGDDVVAVENANMANNSRGIETLTVV